MGMLVGGSLACIFWIQCGHQSWFTLGRQLVRVVLPASTSRTIVGKSYNHGGSPAMFFFLLFPWMRVAFMRGHTELLNRGASGLRSLPEHMALFLTQQHALVQICSAGRCSADPQLRRCTLLFAFECRQSC